MGFQVVPEAALPVDFASVLVSEPAAITKKMRKLPIGVRNSSPRETV